MLKYTLQTISTLGILQQFCAITMPLKLLPNHLVKTVPVVSFFMKSNA